MSIAVVANEEVNPLTLELATYSDADFDLIHKFGSRQLPISPGQSAPKEHLANLSRCTNVLGFLELRRICQRFGQLGLKGRFIFFDPIPGQQFACFDHIK
jgi:hypothetical protein